MRAQRAANPAAADLVRHALADVGGNANLARSWAQARARAGRRGARRELLDAYPRHRHPGAAAVGRRGPARIRSPTAEEALDLLPDALLRVVPRTGYLMAYDDPVGVAREIAAFCG